MKKAMTPTKDRPTTMISMRIPVDVVEKLKKIAPAKGMTGYQALIKYYVGKGLREDLDLFQELELGEEQDPAVGEISQDRTHDLVASASRQSGSGSRSGPKDTAKQTGPHVAAKEQKQQLA
jgi:hypothetical protein